MARVPCLVLNNNCFNLIWSKPCSLLLSYFLPFSPFQQFREQDVTYACSCNNVSILKRALMWGSGDLDSIPDLSLPSSREDLRKATLLSLWLCFASGQWEMSLTKGAQEKACWSIIWIGAPKGSISAGLQGAESGLQFSRLLKMDLY